MSKLRLLPLVHRDLGWLHRARVSFLGWDTDLVVNDVTVSRGI